MEYEDKCPRKYYKLGILAQLERVVLEEAKKILEAENYELVYLQNFIDGYAHAYDSEMGPELFEGMEDVGVGMRRRAAFLCETGCADRCDEKRMIDEAHEVVPHYAYPIEREFKK